MHLLNKSRKVGLVTIGYPAVPDPPPPTFRGRPLLNPDRCTGDGECAAACPTKSLTVEADPANGRRIWTLDLAPCLFCGLCAEVCPNGALTVTTEYELAVRDRRDLVTRVIVQERPGATTAPAPPPPPTPEETLGQQLSARIRRLFRRSLHLRHVDVGSDNAAEWELNALLNPVYDIQRLGIDVVASPRHADALIVTGAVSRNSTMALRRVYAATPEPRLVVAIGADACGGGLLRDGYATHGGVDQVVPVDVYIPGCPPRPTAIIHGLLLAMDRLEQRIHYSETTVTAPAE